MSGPGKYQATICYVGAPDDFASNYRELEERLSRMRWPLSEVMSNRSLGLTQRRWQVELSRRSDRSSLQSLIDGCRFRELHPR